MSGWLRLRSLISRMVRLDGKRREPEGNYIQFKDIFAACFSFRSVNNNNGLGIICVRAALYIPLSNRMRDLDEMVFEGPSTFSSSTSLTIFLEAMDKTEVGTLDWYLFSGILDVRYPPNSEGLNLIIQSLG